MLILIKVKYSPRLIVLLVLPVFICLGCKNTPPPNDSAQAETTDDTKTEEEIDPSIQIPPVGSALPVSAFREIWAYVFADEESALTPGLPISDVGYFGAEVNSYGALIDVPNRRKLRAFPGRVHLVVACNGKALSHFVLKHGSTERKTLIADLLAASKDYDGLQIDFENIPQKDGEPYLSFLKELRAGLGNKMFTVALAARTRKIADDVYDYEKILPFVDRILVMAYDEHWSNSAPGPIASLPWCKKVANYSLNVIGKEKLVMGIPFYGRTWGNIKPNRAFYHSGIERTHREQGSPEIRRENGIPTFRYETPLSVTVYYDDEYSLSARMEMYRTMGIASIGFWRLGQETPAVWKQIKLNSP